MLLFAGAGVSGFVWNSRRALTYNAEGRYFDSESAVVLLEQAVAVYGALAILLCVLAAICWTVSGKL